MQEKVVTKLVQEVLSQLLALSERTRQVSLDQLGDAIGGRPLSNEELELVIDGLEQAGRFVTAPFDQDVVDHLRAVIATASDIRRSGQLATVDGIALRAGLTVEEVRTALAFARVMGQ